MLAPLKPTKERVSRLTSAATIADVLDHATMKLAGEEFTRAWPPLIKMDAAVKAKVERMFAGEI